MDLAERRWAYSIGLASELSRVKGMGSWPIRADTRAQEGLVVTSTLSADGRPSSPAPATISARAEGITNHSTGDSYGQQEPGLTVFASQFSHSLAKPPLAKTTRAVFAW